MKPQCNGFLAHLIPETFGRPMLSFIKLPTASTFFIKTPKFLLPTILSHADPIIFNLCFTSSADSLKPRMALNACNERGKSHEDLYLRVRITQRRRQFEHGV